MNNDFRETGHLFVRYDTPEELETLKGLFRAMGIRNSEAYARMRFDKYGTKLYDVWLQDRIWDAGTEYEQVCTAMTVHYMGQPSHCAALVSGGGRVYTVAEFARLIETDFRVLPRWPLVNVPHDGWKFPDELMASVCVSREKFMEYHETMRDKRITTVLPGTLCGGNSCEKFEVSRLLCDPERFIGPEEVMERYGMGFCYERVYDGTKIKNITDDLKAAAKKYYSAHHAVLDKRCRQHDRILFFDLHSYHDAIVPPSMIPLDGTPDVDVGTDERFTPPALLQSVRSRFEEAGFRVGVNTPYSGTLIPNAVLKGECACDLIGIMVELHRRSYLGEDGRPDPTKTERVRQAFCKITADCAEL